MFKIALKSTLAKKLRLVSTALSVILGVAFLTGTLVFTDTIKRTFDDLFADVFAGTDSYVRSESTVDLGMGNEQRGRIPESVVDTVLGVPGWTTRRGSCRDSPNSSAPMERRSVIPARARRRSA